MPGHSFALGVWGAFLDKASVLLWGRAQGLRGSRRQSHEECLLWLGSKSVGLLGKEPWTLMKVRVCQWVTGRVSATLQFHARVWSTPHPWPLCLLQGSCMPSGAMMGPLASAWAPWSSTTQRPMNGHTWRTWALAAAAQVWGGGGESGFSGQAVFVLTCGNCGGQELNVLPYFPSLLSPFSIYNPTRTFAAS